MQILPIAQSKPIGISDGAFLGRTSGADKPGEGEFVLKRASGMGGCRMYGGAIWLAGFI
jgi:hypothetical protein